MAFLAWFHPQQQPDVPNLAGKRLALEELRCGYDRQHAAADGLDGKLQTIFVSTGLAITLAAAIQVTALQQRIGRHFAIAPRRRPGLLFHPLPGSPGERCALSTTSLRSRMTGRC